MESREEYRVLYTGSGSISHEDSALYRYTCDYTGIELVGVLTARTLLHYAHVHSSLDSAGAAPGATNSPASHSSRTRCGNSM